ncbi:MAG: CBS domain-containing protein [Bacteriovoracaceae bacterium]|jgi:CBS domain-containing protein|nr:CBS domain-containing protein [Bacteriovoracaceae bacterium]
MKFIRDLKKTMIGEFVTTFISTVDESTSLNEIQEMMDIEKIRHIPITSKEGKALGIISDRDVAVISNLELAKKYTAGDLMTPNPYCVKSDSPLREVVAEMARKKYGSVLVKSEEDKVIGIFTSTDALHALHDLLGEEILEDSEYYKSFISNYGGHS